MYDIIFMYLVCTLFVDLQSECTISNFQVNHTFNQSKVFLPDTCKFGYIKNWDYLKWKKYFQYFSVTVIWTNG